MKKQAEFDFFLQISAQKCLQLKKNHYLCNRKSEMIAKGIGVWCNGNTADSGPAFPGSSPGTPTN